MIFAVLQAKRSFCPSFCLECSIRHSGYEYSSRALYLSLTSELNQQLPEVILFSVHFVEEFFAIVRLRICHCWFLGFLL